MHEITPQLEQALRAQGLDDAQLADLRRNGRIEHTDDAGNTTTIEIPAEDHAADGHAPETVSVTGTSATPAKPVEMVQGATGARIPTGEHRRSGAMPPDHAAGPYVGGMPRASSGGSGSALLPVLIGLLAIAALIYFIAR